jgi:UDP-N-acetylglucosamine 4,6-dehydratase
MNILLTGATGTFGQAFLRYVLIERRAKVNKLAAFARSESRLAILNSEYQKYEEFRPFLGDVRDERRLLEACDGMDTVIHAAALKRVDGGAYNPLEMHKTNVQGSINVAEAARASGVKNVILISSDKAVAPINTYGASKYQAENCLRELNSYSAPKGTKISCVRYGNVLASTGSVLTIWSKQKRQGDSITITDREMTRFWLTADDAVSHVFRSLELMRGGEIFIPNIQSSSIETLAKAYASSHKIEVVGKRAGGEKVHESLINSDEQERAISMKGIIVIPPAIASWTTEEWKGDDSVDIPNPYSSNSPSCCLHGEVSIAEVISNYFADYASGPAM